MFIFLKRSEINQIMKKAIEFIKKQNFYLPKFAYWTVDDWEMKGKEINEIIENQLGWDITDFGTGNFYKTGLVVFTIRNGNYKDTSIHTKPYCEKLLITEEEQVTPFHHHYSKKEDIINRGVGILQIEIYKSDEIDNLLDDSVTLSIDGFRKTYEPGTIIELEPGDSIYLPPDVYHKFWAKKGHGKVLIGEVSTVNNDYVDNKFFHDDKRFSDIEEDEEPLYLLYDDYKNYIHL